MSITAVAPAMYISTPGNWVALDLDVLGDQQLVGRLVDDRVAEVPALAVHRDELVGLLARTTRAARDAGVAFAAVMLDTRDDETPVVASLSVAIVACVGDEPGTDGDHELVQLRAGQATLCERVHPTAIVAGGPELLVLTSQYVLALEEPQSLAVLTFASPNVLERDSLTLVFRRIAETFELNPHHNVD